jgi:malate synthase
MTTRPKRKKSKAAAARTSAKKAAAKKAKKKPVAKARGAKPARRRKVKASKKTMARGARSKAAAKGPKRSARRRLGPFGASGRRLTVASGRGRARARVSSRRPIAKSAIRTPRVSGVAIKGAMGPRYGEVLTPAALRFLADLHREFEGPRSMALATRGAQPHIDDADGLPGLRPGTSVIRLDAVRSVAQLVADLQEGRVPTARAADRRSLREALKSDAAILVADFADMSAPTWSASIEGQINLKDHWGGKLAVANSAGRRREQLPDTSALIVRPRGWQRVEPHLTVDGAPVAAALLDVGLCLFHNARAQLAAGAVPHFDLPQLASHQEARLWADMLAFAQERFGLAPGTIRALMRIENPSRETSSAAFQLIV